MKRKDDTRMLRFLVTGAAFLFIAAAVPLSGAGLFLAAQAAALALGGASSSLSTSGIAAWISSRPR